jgi:uncharacterized protein DUF3108
MTSATAAARRTAGAVAAVAAATLALVGCGPTASSASGSGGSSTPASGGSTTPGSGSSGGGVSGTSVFFPVAVGNTWVYEVKTVAGTGTSTDKMVAVAPIASGQRVTMTTSVDEPGLGKLPALKLAYIFHSDGSITVPSNELGTSGAKVTTKSGSITWPDAAEIASGQPHTDTVVLAITIAGKTSTYTEHVVVQGAGTATVVVPAGTFQTNIIDQTMTSKFDGYASKLEIRTWVATGVGPVKQELMTIAGSKSTITNTEELKSFTKG